MSTDQTTDGYRVKSHAELTQLDVYPQEQELVAHARIKHPTAAWWWGARKVNRAFGAWCYLCECHIVTWSRAYPATQKAKREIAVHRNVHVAEFRLTRRAERNPE